MAGEPCDFISVASLCRSFMMVASAILILFFYLGSYTVIRPTGILFLITGPCAGSLLLHITKQTRTSFFGDGRAFESTIIKLIEDSNSRPLNWEITARSYHYDRWPFWHCGSCHLYHLYLTVLLHSNKTNKIHFLFLLKILINDKTNLVILTRPVWFKTT